MKTTNKLSKKNILIGLLLLVILSLALSNTDERKLIDKLNDDEVLIDKFIDFSTDGYERKINLSKNKMESVIDTDEAPEASTEADTSARKPFNTQPGPPSPFG